MNYIESQGLSTYMTNLTYTEKYTYIYTRDDIFTLKKQDRCINAKW